MQLSGGQFQGKLQPAIREPDRIEKAIRDVKEPNSFLIKYRNTVSSHWRQRKNNCFLLECKINSLLFSSLPLSPSSRLERRKHWRTDFSIYVHEWSSCGPARKKTTSPDCLWSLTSPVGTEQKKTTNGRCKKQRPKKNAFKLEYQRSNVSEAEICANVCI